MNLKKKLILIGVSALSIFTLAACSSKDNEDIATMKGGKITVQDFYNQAKSQSANQQLVQQMIIYKVMENAYGDKVSDKKVDAEYKKQAKQYGDQFSSLLKQSGYTKDTYKTLIKQNLAYQAALDANMKITDKDLKTAWESFHPEVEAQIIVAASKDDATKALDRVNGGEDFGTVAKDVSEDTATKKDGGKIKFDSQSTDVPSDVQQAAFKLEDGKVSDVIESNNGYSTSYYIVKMVKNKAKGNSMDPYKKELKTIAQENKRQDSTFVQSVIKKELEKANVKIKDDAFKNVLSDFLGTKSSSSGAATNNSTAATSSTAATESSSAATESTSSTATTESTAASSTAASTTESSSAE
ncbi:MAG: peptidylprolyl isomerase [Enterococcaceae bacterium]|jgi:foldase protein PrsA|nr:peptidylprolyl isomerase [Enterococcaceae bacterium]MCI1919837.1 peptidylprolyl isomerase [Enterococcaceae bacterium]